MNSMKAVIMAGGEGTRLRPVSTGRPKPMVPILDKPVLSHILELLKRAGIRDVCTTLGYMPEAVIDYYGSGEEFGMNITHRREDKPLGTAGGILACRDFYGDEDFLVISGDAACDFDLLPLIKEHRKHKPQITIALYSHPEPLQYGLVVTDKDGVVRAFVEKPSWERVITDRVNTGIYIVSPKAMEHVPADRAFDFAKDLFPLVMAKGGEIRAVTLEGYWCDIGSPASYHASCMDALMGRLEARPKAELRRDGVWSAIPLPEDAEIIPPVIIGADAVIEGGAVIGPNAVIGSKSRVCRGAEVSGSVIDGCVIKEGARVHGAVVCPGAAVETGCEVKPGEVIGPPGVQYVPPEIKRPVKQAGRSPMDAVREISCPSRAALMRAISENMVAFGAEFDDGLTLSDEKGTVHIFPSPDREALIIEARSHEAEASEELCAEYENLARKMVNNE